MTPAPVEFGAASRDRYWTILEALFAEIGYRDYLGALQRYRAEHPRDVRLTSMSSYLVDYPFANRLFPGALDVLEGLCAWGPTVIVSDGVERIGDLLTHDLPALLSPEVTR